MMASGLLRPISVMAVASTLVSVDLFMKASGKVIRPAVRVVLSIATVMYTKVSGSTTSSMVMEPKNMLKEHTMKATGKMISSMAMAKSLGQVTLSTKESTRMARNTAGVSSSGLIKALMKVIS